MANRLHKMLQPGERVLYRPHIGLVAFLKCWLVYTVAFALFFYSTLWLLDTALPWSALGDMRSEPGMVALAAGAFTLYLLLLFLIRGRHVALLTDDRLLCRGSPIARQVTILPLSEIARVHGLATGSRLPVQVESAEGKYFAFDEGPYARDHGREVARAAGLSLPTKSAPTAEWTAGLIHWARVSCVIVTMPLSFWLLLNILGIVIEATESSPLFAFIISIGLIFILPLVGFTGGRLMGPILAILCLRRAVTLEDMREAIHLLVRRGLILRSDDDFGRLDPIVLRVANWIYGKPITSQENRGEEHVR